MRGILKPGGADDERQRVSAQPCNPSQIGTRLLATTGEPRFTQRGAGGLCHAHTCRIGIDRPLWRDAHEPALARLGECFHANARLDPHLTGLTGVTGARFGSLNDAPLLPAFGWWIDGIFVPV
jgi:hypothetical protein